MRCQSFAFRLYKQQQTDSHDDHTTDQAIDGQMTLIIFLGSRQQSVQGDKNHNPCDCSENKTEYEIVQKRH